MTSKVDRTSYADMLRDRLTRGYGFGLYAGGKSVEDLIEEIRERGLHYVMEWNTVGDALETEMKETAQGFIREQVAETDSDEELFRLADRLALGHSHFGLNSGSGMGSARNASGTQLVAMATANAIRSDARRAVAQATELALQEVVSERFKDTIRAQEEKVNEVRGLQDKFDRARTDASREAITAESEVKLEALKVSKAEVVEEIMEFVRETELPQALDIESALSYTLDRLGSWR